MTNKPGPPPRGDNRPRPVSTRRSHVHFAGGPPVAGNVTPTEATWPIISSSNSVASHPTELPTLTDFLAQELGDLLRRTPPAERAALIERFRSLLADADTA